MDNNRTRAQRGDLQAGCAHKQHVVARQLVARQAVLPCCLTHGPSGCTAPHLEGAKNLGGGNVEVVGLQQLAAEGVEETELF